MKRVFVVLSNLLTGLFFVWILTIWSDTYVSYYYPNVAVLSSSPDSSFTRVSEELTELATETDSLIAIQHQDPGSSGSPVFSYTPFGSGELPDGLTEKPLEEAANSSLITNYFVFRGNVDVEHLKDRLSQAGLMNLHAYRPSGLNTLANLFSSGFQRICLLIFFLTFGALSLISQIRSMRTAGIRLISGESRWKIFLRPLRQDLVNALAGCVAGLGLALILGQMVSLPSVTFYPIGLGLLVYNLCLLLISLFFASLFAVAIKKVHLMQVIKGQIPVKGIIGLILVGQLLAITIVATGANRTLIYSQAWKQQEQGQHVWNKESDLISLSTGREGVDPRQDQKEVIRKQKIWFALVDQAVSEQKAFLSQHNLVERVMQTGIGSSANLSSSPIWQDYGPGGNLLLVTPQYLKHQNIALSPEIEVRINQLATGEFVLLLPDHLRPEESHYKAMFEKDLTNRVSSQELRQEMVATVAYLETGQERFVYNTTPISYQQFLRDPIIIVLTPQSTGEQAYAFWEQAVQSYFLFNHLRDAQSLIEEYGIENWVAELKTGHQIHQTLLNNLQREIWTMLAGAILGMLTSILMFHTMNRLYFEEFRREIFIKRIAGLGFIEIHRTYLLAQTLVFLLGFLVAIVFATDILVAFVVLLLFIGISVLQLAIQMKKENKMSTLILKGA